MKKNMKIYQENKEKIEDYLFIITVLIFVISTIANAPHVFAIWRSDALGCYMQLFISGDMACSNIRFKKTKRMDLVNIYR